MRKNRSSGLGKRARRGALALLLLSLVTGPVAESALGAASARPRVATLNCPPAQTPGIAQDFVLDSPVQGGTSEPATQTLTLAGVDRNLLALTSENCWGVLNPDYQTLETQGPVVLNGVVLDPVTKTGSAVPTLTVEPSGSADGGTGAIVTASGDDTSYDVEVPEAGTSLATIGRIDLGSDPILYSNPTNNPADDVLGAFGPSPDGVTVGGQSITGGEIDLSGVQELHLSATVPLPSEFSLGPSGGGAVTGQIDFDTAPPAGVGGGGGGGAGNSGVGGGGLPPLPPNPCTQDPHAIIPACPPPTKYLINYLEPRRDLLALAPAISLSEPVELSAPNLYLGGLDLTDVTFSYDPSDGVWSGGGVLQIGDYGLDAAPPPSTNGLSFSSTGAFLHGGAGVDLPGGGVPLFPGVNLTAISVGFSLDPTRLTGTATILAGGAIEVPGSTLVIFADRAQPYTYQPNDLPGVPALQDNSPITGFAMGISGPVQLQNLNISLSHGYVFYVAPAYLEFGGSFDVSPIGFVELDGGVSGALDLDTHQYDLSGSISGCIDFPNPIGKQCATLEGVLSSEGVGACGSFLGVGAYFRYSWSGNLTIDFGCDLGPITVDVQPETLAPGAPRQVTIPAGVPVTSIIVKSARGTPRVEVRGPGGVDASNPKAGLPVEAPGITIMPLSGLHETLIGIESPAAGTWTIRALKGSPTITSLEHANGVAAVTPIASVSRQGAAYSLHYRVGREPGTRVTFAERAAGVFQVIGAASAAAGSIAFTPVPAESTSRSIVAMVTHDGLPREDLVVGHFGVARPGGGATPGGLSATRSGRTLEVSWSAGSADSGYVVTAALSDGRRLVLVPAPGTTSVAVPDLAPGQSATISLYGTGPLGVLGRAAELRVAPAGSAAAVTGLVAAPHGADLGLHWAATPGALGYLVELRASGHHGGESVITWRPSLSPSVADATLGSGASLEISVRAITPEGLGAPESYTYRP